MHGVHMADAPEAWMQVDDTFHPVIVGCERPAGHDMSFSVTLRTTSGKIGNWPGLKINEEAKKTPKGQPLQHPCLRTY